MIAFFGMGLLGSNFVRAARARGESVHVWNRSPGKARALEELGAEAFDDPAAAARGALRVHLTLSDDAAVDDVLARALPGLAPGAIVVDHTTTSPAGTRARAERLAAQQVEFLHAPVFMGPQNAREQTGVMLASGDRTRFERLRPELEKMTGKLVFLGEDPGQAASFKLLGNLFLMFVTAGLAETLTLGKALGVPAEEAVKLFDVFNPGLTLPARIARVLGANFSQPSWELQMARKDARLMLEAARENAESLAVLPSIAELMDRFIARGHAHDDWTVIAKDALAR
jgi:3-hydroxyisobutyrate dehydrogenase